MPFLDNEGLLQLADSLEIHLVPKKMLAATGPGQVLASTEPEPGVFEVRMTDAKAAMIAYENTALPEGIDPNVGAALDSIAASLRRKNYVLNSNFENPINQDGVTAVTSMAVEYIIDGWQSLNAVQQTTAVNTIERCLEVDGVASAGLSQRFEFPSDFADKVCTLSIYAKSTAPFVLGMDTGGQYPTGDIIQPDETYQVYSFTYDLTSARLERIFVRLSEAGRLSAKWVKLEIGEAATPYEPPDYDAELLRCQYYKVTYSLPAVSPIIGFAKASSASAAMCSLALPRQMRVKNGGIPLRQIGTPGISLVAYGGAGAVTGASMAANAQVVTNMAHINITANGLVAGEMYIVYAATATKFVVDAQL